MTQQNENVLIVGLGGLGCPIASCLLESGVRHLTLLDDDTVDISNLHRQTLYTKKDIGQYKADVAEIALKKLHVHSNVHVQKKRDRLVPENALHYFEQSSLVLEGSDNLPTKFLAVDAARQAKVPIIQGGAVRWQGWAMATLPDRGPCMRCVFEDLPHDHIETCAEAGVIGPVVGVIAALMATLALKVINKDASAQGELWSYDGLAGTLRKTRVHSRSGCELCLGHFHKIDRERYISSCAYA